MSRFSACCFIYASEQLEQRCVVGCTTQMVVFKKRLRVGRSQRSGKKLILLNVATYMIRVRANSQYQSWVLHVAYVDVDHWLSNIAILFMYCYWSPSLVGTHKVSAAESSCHTVDFSSGMLRGLNAQKVLQECHRLAQFATHVRFLKRNWGARFAWDWHCLHSFREYLRNKRCSSRAEINSNNNVLYLWLENCSVKIMSVLA